MNRRQVLVAGVLGSMPMLSGCTGEGEGFNARFTMNRVSDRDIAERLILTLNPENEDHRVAARAVTKESTTIEATGEPFPPDTPFIYEGSIYEVTTTEVDQSPATTFSFTLNPVDETEPADENETVRYEDLPDVDKQAFSDHGWSESDPFIGMSSTVRYRDDQINDSVLVPESEKSVIVWPDARGRFTVDGSRATAIRTFEYESRVVAESAENYGRDVRKRIEFELGDLTDAEREIVSEAVNEGIYLISENESVPDAMYRLAGRFENQEKLVRPDKDLAQDDSINGDYVIRYQGSVYRSTLTLSNGDEALSS